jgi:hypothetical protein
MIRGVDTCVATNFCLAEILNHPILYSIAQALHHLPENLVCDLTIRPRVRTDKVL